MFYSKIFFRHFKVEVNKNLFNPSLLSSDSTLERRDFPLRNGLMGMIAQSDITNYLFLLYA